MTTPSPTCPYCGAPATYEPDSSCVYQRNYGPIWRCVPCKAWVGCHKGTKKPLGRLADAELRKAKIAAHAAFDWRWKHGAMSRGQAYKWLAESMGLTQEETHIGAFDLDQCRRVVELCRARKEEPCSAR